MDILSDFQKEREVRNELIRKGFFGACGYADALRGATSEAQKEQITKMLLDWLQKVDDEIEVHDQKWIDKLIKK